MWTDYGWPHKSRSNLDIDIVPQESAPYDDLVMSVSAVCDGRCIARSKEFFINVAVRNCLDAYYVKHAEVEKQPFFV